MVVRALYFVLNLWALKPQLVRIKGDERKTKISKRDRKWITSCRKLYRKSSHKIDIIGVSISKEKINRNNQLDGARANVKVFN